VASSKPRIAVFAGPTATIMNSAPLVTSNQARRQHGLPLRTDRWGAPLANDMLRPQRLAAPVTVYVEQFSAHPLERSVAHLYAPPDGYLDAAGAFHPERSSASDVPVFEIQLRPEDGVIPLPYMARQSDGTAWEADTAFPGAPADQSRQPFYPDASRIFEEIDRLGVDNAGVGNLLAGQAEYDFFRGLPSSGYPAGLPAEERTDTGDGDLPPEEIWRDYFPYRPAHLRREPTRTSLATLTNRVRAALAGGDYAGALWLEGSPSTEDTTYWLGLVIDTTVPIVGCQAPDLPHGTIGATGDRHLVDAVRYLVSGVWKDEAGRDKVGAVVISAYQLFAARDVQKGDGRPGGFMATGGHGGIVGTTGETGTPRLTYLPVHRHTWQSEVRLSVLPASVGGVRGSGSRAEPVVVATRDAAGDLLPDAVPHLSFHKHARYARGTTSSAPDEEVALLAQLEDNLRNHPLAGFVAEGTTPHGNTTSSADTVLRRATYLGMPVVRTGRGFSQGFVAPERVRNEIAGSNLTPTKARLLLMACLLKLGALPIAADPDHPTADEQSATREAIAAYQAIFDSH
jgi:hypothetical protein